MIRHLLSIFAIAILLAGCAHKGASINPGSNEALVWQQFQDSPHSPAGQMLSGSMRFGTADDTRRVTYMLWSTGTTEESCAVRLQVSAGVGAVIAEALFKDGRMLLVLPRDGKAYTGRDVPENISRILGFSFPFDVARLREYLLGAYFTALDSPTAEGYDISADGSPVFHCVNSSGRIDITLDGKGMPATLSIPGSWKLSTTFGPDGLPKRLDGTMIGTEGESRLVLLIKERTQHGLTSSANTGLTVPDGFTVYDIDG